MGRSVNMQLSVVILVLLSGSSASPNPSSGVTLNTDHLQLTFPASAVSPHSLMLSESSILLLGGHHHHNDYQLLHCHLHLLFGRPGRVHHTQTSWYHRR